MKKQLLVSSLGLLSMAATADEVSIDLGQSVKQSVQLETSVGPLAANVYLPKGVKQPPVVVITGAWTTVKEQMPAVYAKALAEKGYASVTFDFRGWGQSANGVRYLEDPSRKAQDINAVVNALAELAPFSQSTIYGVGICASSGYMLDTAVENSKIDAVALVAPWLHDKALATSIYGGEESVKGLLATSKAATEADEPAYIEAASLTNDKSLMYQAPYYTESDRGLIPEYDNQFNLASWGPWLNYDAQLTAEQIKQPVLMVASEAMALPAGAHQYLDKAGDNVSAVWLDNVSQFDFYDQPAAVNQAVDAIDAFFKANP